MPLQNRVNPFGEIVAIAAEGTFMGNRGVLHDNNRTLTHKRWTHKHWIICVLEYKDSKENPRTVMTPGEYTELFFLDEATALAAGHRPCALCRREAFNNFKADWVKGNAHLDLPEFVGVDCLDGILQGERVAADGVKVTSEAVLGDLPDGVMIILPGESDAAGLMWKGKVHPWSFKGYGAPVTVRATEKVKVLTPASTVNALRAGFVPVVAVK